MAALVLYTSKGEGSAAPVLLGAAADGLELGAAHLVPFVAEVAEDLGAAVVANHGGELPVAQELEHRLHPLARAGTGEVHRPGLQHLEVALVLTDELAGEEQGVVTGGAREELV